MVSGAPAGARLELSLRLQRFKPSLGNRLAVCPADRRRRKAAPLATLREPPPARIASAPSQAPDISTGCFPAWRITISTERACRPEKLNVFGAEGRAAAL